ncbi:MAG TPA: hypothetical protein VIE42_07780 [Steroidobacteraceae bacterium]
MNLKLLSGTLTVLAGSVLLASCGGSNGNPYAGLPTTAQPLNTAQVLAMAKTSSESSDPLPVDGGALQVAGADDDTSDPMVVI